MLEIGSIVDGKYKILNKIGQGGMSVVYLAMNERANKQWAIKEVRKDGVKDYEVVKQGLIAETDILKKLNHPNLPSIIDVIDCEDTFLIVMDYIEGKTLDYWLKREGAQPQERVVEWAKQICDVLGYLHSRKPPIIYRDLKPANVMLKPNGQIEIIDFGTAREFKETSIEDTSCLGTQGYAAPEQYGGHGQTDARTDIYTLGATMYHLLTGHNPSLPPYEMYPIRKWNPNLSSGLEEIVLKCTQRNPADRYQSCAELMYALEHYSELDIEYKKKQKLKWKTFIASCSLAVLSLVGCIGFKTAEVLATGNSYDYYMDEASTAADPAQKQELYESAIKVDPGRPEAYLELLNLFTYGVGNSDFDFSQDEAASMTAILGYTGKGNRTNESYFERSKEYGQFAFDMGIAYLYGYEGEGNTQLSQAWFEKAAQSRDLDANERDMAERLSMVAKYQTEMNRPDVSGYESSTSPRDYWEAVQLITEEDFLSEASPQTALVICEGIVSQIGTNVLELKDSGIEEDDILNKLSDIEDYLEANTFSTSRPETTAANAEKKQEILSEITLAENQVEIAFSSNGSGRGTGGDTYAGS